MKLESTDFPQGPETRLLRGGGRPSRDARVLRVRGGMDLGRIVRALATALVVVPSLAAISPLATAWKGIEALKGQAPVIVRVEGKSRIYFRATLQQPLVVSIAGPSRIRVVSRVELPPGAETPITYRVRVATARRVLKEKQTQAPGSTDAFLANGAARLGQSRQMIVSVPKGRQSVKISVEGVDAVLVRLLTAAPARGKKRTVSLSPIEAPRSVSLKDDERLVPYYSALPGKPVRFRVVGPTTLDLITRLDFDATMRGVQSYHLAIADGGKPIREVEYKTTKALTAMYPDLKDRVPSKFRRLRLPIATGPHEISVALVKPKDGSVEVHARIPEPAVGNAE